MSTLIRWIISVLFAALAMVFAVANREPVTVIWSPVNDPIEIPLFAVALGGILAGFIIGAFLVWLNGSTTRREKRQQAKRLKKIEKELEKYRDADTNESLEELLS